MALIANSTYAYVNLDDVQVFVNTDDLVDRGDWSSLNSYSVGHVVLYQGAHYYCLTANTGTAPDGNISDEWSSLVMIREGAAPDSEYILNGTRVIRDYHVAWGTNAANNEVGAHSIPYNGSYATVQAALDALFYVELDISSFSNNKGNQEIGSTASGIVLSWAYNKDVTEQSINQGIGSLPVGDRSYNVSGSISSNTTWTLSATDGTTPVNGNTSISFLNKRYWGESSETSLNDAQIIALNSELSSSRVQSRTFTPSGEYVYFAWPTSFGTPTFTVNGLLNTAWTKVTRAFVNASGYSASYDIYRSDNLLTGTFVIAVS